MELHAYKHTEEYDNYIVTIVGTYTQQEQQVLFAKNQWQSAVVNATVSLGFWRNSKRFSFKYYEFCHPGTRIEGFSSGAADNYIHHNVPSIAQIINNQLANLIRAYQLEQRDAIFNGGFDGGPVIDMSPIPPGSIIPAVPPAPRGIPPIGKLSLDGIPTRNFSRINLADFVKEKIAPTAPANVPEVEHITWHFAEPEHEDDHRVMLYAVLSAEERAIIKRFGLHHHSFGEVPLFDEDALERLQHAQEMELAATIDAAVRASLRIEHKEQLKYAREAKIDITLEFYFSYPFVREYPNRWKATAAQKNLQSIMMKIKQMLDEHRDR